MTDTELLDWLREQSLHCFRENHLGAQVYVDAVADRLEQLTAPHEPPGKRPVTHEREAAIRKFVETTDESGGGTFWREAYRGLRATLALLDHKDKQHGNDVAILTDALVADNRFDLGVKAGVALALGAIETWERQTKAAGLLTYSAQCALSDVRKAIIDACGPAQTPPHLRTLDRLRKLETALVEIVAAWDKGYDGISAMSVAIRPTIEAARAALEDA